MIYSFDSKDDNYNKFVAELSEQPLDYEVISRDKIVIRIFGHVDDDLRKRLDQISGKGKLILKKAADDVTLFNEIKRGKIIIAGPCSVESESQIDEIAGFLSGLGVRYLRGGAFKPRTQSSSFQGLGKVGLKILSEAAAKYNMKVVTELMDRSQLDEVYQYADIIQVGSRNMFNYTLLTALGAVDKTILFKRGMAATIDEWLHAADYIRKGGNERIILCERGIRTFEKRTRFTLDVLAIPIARQLSGLPVIADASHAAGDRKLVPPLVKAALAAGADGIMVEVHNNPKDALSDGAQSMTFTDFNNLLDDLASLGYEIVHKSRRRNPAKF
ncbi:MAG: 3-deoxy-7-phosphoheptulonate synthase [candidate division Zixibacteria bacterium]